MSKKQFKASLEIIGINPFVFVPEEFLKTVFRQAKKDKGAIPVCGTVNDKPYKQTLVRYKGEWRLYINLQMLKNSPKRIGEMIDITLSFDPEERTIAPHPDFIKALNKNKEAKKVFDALRPSLQHEIVRYITRLKTIESVNRNIVKAIDFLLGKGKFVGREKP